MGKRTIRGSSVRSCVVCSQEFPSVYLPVRSPYLRIVNCKEMTCHFIGTKYLGCETMKTCRRTIGRIACIAEMQPIATYVSSPACMRVLSTNNRTVAVSDASDKHFTYILCMTNTLFKTCFKTPLKSNTA